MPKVSIILPVYNGAQYLEQAMASVIKQSFLDFELIAINDGSSDNSAGILEQWRQKDPRIKIINHTQNLALVATLNEGLAAANGMFIARIDCDDTWNSGTKLQKQVDFLEKHQDYALVGTWAEMIDGNGMFAYNFTPPSEDSQIRRQLLWHNCFVHSSILARKDVMLKAGGYSPKQRYLEDYGLWLRMGLIAKLANIPEVLVRYRLSSGGVTQTHNKEQIRAALALVREFKNKYPGFLRAWLKWNLQKFFKNLS